MKEFNVIVYNINSKEFESYNIIPYLLSCYKKEKNKLKTFDEFKEFIKNKSMYRFWSRCEYEMICHGWPVRKNDYKLDIHEQVMMNIDIIAKILYEEIENQ